MGEFDEISYSKANKATSQLAEMSRYPHRKNISITGTGNDETDYIMKLNVHRGNPVGDMVGTDIFLNNGCKTDFSDVRFLDTNGNELEYYIQSHGNYEIIYDNLKLGIHNIVYKGAIYASRIGGTIRGIYKSVDNGQTYTLLTPKASFANHFDLVFIDSSGNIYGTKDYGDLYRSTDDGVTWTAVLIPGESGYIMASCFAEDSLGNLFAGRYQPFNSRGVTIFKSTDKGETWSPCYTNAITSLHHIHSVAVDPFTDNIYAGIDGTGPSDKRTIRSIDHGATWTEIRTGHGADSTVMIFPSAGLRFFGGGNTAECVALFSTIDDTTFTPVLPVGASLQGAAILNGYIYALGTAVNTNLYSQIYRINLDGTNPTTIWTGKYDPSDAFAGYYYAFLPDTPTAATEKQLLMGTNSLTNLYKKARLYSGGQHYQATFHIKIPNLPAAGTDIDIICGNPSAISNSKNTIYAHPAIALPNPALRLLIDEGTGTAIADTSGNQRHGTLSHTENKGAWDVVQGRRAGGTYPWIYRDGKSYAFNGGDMITIPADATLDALTKNFSIVVCVKTTHTTVPQDIVSKGTDNNKFALQIRSPNNFCAGTQYGNGSAKTQFVYGSGLGLENGEWHMIGVVIDDTSPTVKGQIIVDGRLSNAVALSYNPVIAPEAPWIIGGSSVYANICDVQIYPYALSALQVQQLYENRMVAATEPEVVTTLV